MGVPIWHLIFLPARARQAARKGEHVHEENGVPGNFSRRQVLVGAGAAAVALALPETASAAATSGHPQLLGATVNLAAGTYGSCAGGELNLCTAGYFDQYLSSGLTTTIPEAVKVQKVFLKNPLPATPPSAYQNFCAQGGKLLISMKPSQTFSASADSAFQSCVQGFVSAGLTFRIALWNEPNNGDFPSASAYHGYWAHYQPLIKAVSPSIEVVYDPELTGPQYAGNAASVVSYFPAGGPLPDHYYTDFYGTAYNSGTRLDGSDPTGADIQGQADKHGIPLGQGEYAASAVTGYTFDLTKWTSYINYLNSFYTARLQAGKTNGWILYFGSNGSGGLGINGLSGPKDPKIPGLQKLYAALAPSTE
jgi:hypothetical protein